MFETLFANTGDLNSLILRVVLGLVIFPHGAQKLFGWFGGYGFKGTMGFFTGTMKLPAVVAFLVIIGESFGSLALILGLFTRFTAVSIAIILLGAALLVHKENGFFMNWYGAQKGEGYEFHILAIGAALLLTITGAGSYSLDQLIFSL
ncbi:DoxX family protein [Leptospira gomenensis]|uniref:DoxX family protein n=1 Tax=Leptospira gomenensis TaxID=2484974 RepID=A0A5F1YK49_9LEPT|nr:DoxX family protein [Leptospira gomenensis]TGK34874.1 DoxX family protein [Leptospira gomenensis]TGK41123.1 DoxX family protein [Leptospira gomenensis]TGK42075.1 DoxX family protein [Leptospira gomenensis]TGK56337.1 DoxX family protein [Leptospira gomenensis]